MPIYKLKPIELHTGHQIGKYWTEEAEIITATKLGTKPTWVPKYDTDPTFVDGWVWDWKQNDWLATASMGMVRPVLRNKFITDQLIIFIYVHSKEDTTPWEDINTTTTIENDVIEIGTLTMGFDSEKYEFTHDDMTFKVVNDSGIWDEILHPDTVSEVRILYVQSEETKYNEAPRYKHKGVFYGTIDKKSISFFDDVGPVDDMWEYYREYEFTVLNYMSGLKEKSIENLRKKLREEATFFESYFMLDGLYGPQPLQFDPHFYNDPLRNTMRFKFIDVATVIKGIIKLIYGENINISITSDIEFHATYDTAKAGAYPGPWYLDTTKPYTKNIFMLFERIYPGGATSHDTFWDGDGFDNEEVLKTNYSFFHHENCLYLLKDLLLSFGLVWRTKYTPNESDIWKFKIDFNFISRWMGTILKDLTDDMHNDFEGMVEEKESGVVVSVMDYGEVTNSISIKNEGNSKIDVRPAPKTEKMIQLSTPFISHHFELGHTVGYAWKHYGRHLYGIEETKNKYPESETSIFRSEFFPVPLDKYKVDYPEIIKTVAIQPRSRGIEDYPIRRYQQGKDNGGYSYRSTGSTRGVYMSPEDESRQSVYKLYFAEMVANYYAGQFGVYSSIKKTMNFTIDSLDIEPLDIIPISGKSYLVTQVEKDFLNGSSKLEVKEY